MATTISETAVREGKFWGVGLIFMAVFAGWHGYWQPERWYRLDEVFVSDGVVGEPMPILIDRTILRPFTGYYTVTIRSADRIETVCSGGSRVNYRPEASLPDVVTIEWWTAGSAPACRPAMDQQPGRFIMETCVNIDSNIPFTRDGEVCTDSNIFEVRP